MVLLPKPGMGTKHVSGTGPIAKEFVDPTEVDARVDEGSVGDGDKDGDGGKAKKKKKLRSSSVTIEEVRKRADQDVELWRARNERFKNHQKQIELRGAVDEDEDEEDSVILNDPLVLVQKISGMLSKQTEQIEYRPRRPNTGKEAQAGENALRLIEKEREYAWSAALHGPVKYEEFQCELLRGWLCARVSFDSQAVVEWEEGDRDPYSYFPWRIHLADPANIYPNNPTMEFTRVTHRFKTTVGEMRDNSEFGDEGLPEGAGDDEGIEVTAVYEFSKRYDYHCVYYTGKGGSEGFVKKPTAMGYMPWVIVLAGGVFYRGTPWDESDDWTKHVGVGILHTVAKNQELLNKYVTMLATVVGDNANPYRALFTDGTEEEVPQEFRRGGTGKFSKDAKILPVTDAKDATMQGIGALVELLQMRQDRGSISPVLFGGAGANPATAASGFQAAIYMAAAHDIIFPYVRAWELFRSLVYRKILWLFAEHAPLDIPFMVLNPPDARDGKNTWEEFWPQNVVEQGCHVSVNLDPMTVQDRLALGNLAVMLVRENIISRKTARGREFLRLEDPQLEDYQIVSELTRLDQRVMGMMIPAVAEALGEPELAELFRKGQEQQLLAAQQAGMGGQGPGGAGPGPGKLPGPGMDSAGGPPPAALGIDQMEQMRNRERPPEAAAQGGGGAGGIPPGVR